MKHRETMNQMTNKEFIAHRREKDGKHQSLWEHLKETSSLAGQFTSKIGLEKHGELIGLLHDLGKATSIFDQYIRSATGLIDPDEDEYIDAKGMKGKIDHSTAGAQLINRYYLNKGNQYLFISEILPLVIASHHSGLSNCLTTDGEDKFSERMNKLEEDTRLNEAYSNLDDDIKQRINNILTEESTNDFFNKKIISMRENIDSKETSMFNVGLLTRFLFSCLIDADRLNTADFEMMERAKLRNYGKYTEWSVLIKRLNQELSKFTNQNQVDILRQEISNQCFEFSEKPKGLYQLTVPTGGGKTLSSLRFALNHAENHKMDRIIYVIPYTSIIDQNAEKVRGFLENKDKKGKYLNNVVLEHHSNLTPEEENTKQKLLSEDWDAPIVFTTMVQFLETLFGHGTRDARRMHQLANSVIIFDEIQTLPIKCIHLFNVAVRFLTHTCGTTVILCTATQPLLDRVMPKERALEASLDQQMIPDIQNLFKKLKRVEVYDRRKVGGWEETEVAELVEEELKETGSVLTIVNTKKSAVQLFKILKNQSNVQVYHLSTNMCPAHRMKVISDIKECLPDKKPVICISTQLIEAGVDIDFGTVIRYTAGLDSIAQAAGRCNRNGERPKQGRVFIVNPKEENLDRLKDIRTGRNVAERILDEFKDNPEFFDNDILGLKAIERYFEYYFHETKDQMRYPIARNSGAGREDDLFNLLSANTLSVQEYQRKKQASPNIPLRQSFKTAGLEFQTIESASRGVIVPYEEGKNIINELCSAVNIVMQFNLLKKAQRYSVNVYPYIFEKMAEQKIIYEVQKGIGIYYLDNQYYSKDFGLSGSIVNEMELLIFEEVQHGK